MTKNDFDFRTNRLNNDKYSIINSEYHDNAFGSWFIEIKVTPCNFRIVWDWKDGWIYIQKESDKFFNGLKIWNDLCIGKEKNEQNNGTILTIIKNLFA